jgi:hypothetical protein
VKGPVVENRREQELNRTRLIERLDSVEEFEREPVPESKLRGWSSFLGVYAGEHTAGTEFVIGPLFVAHGVTAAGLVFGLLAGNVLAVLSWAFLTAPIATKTRSPCTICWRRSQDVR